MSHLLVSTRFRFALSLVLALGSSLITLAQGSANAAAPAGRTLAVAVSVDRGGAQILAYTLKDRPFAHRDPLPEASPYREGRPVQVEVLLKGKSGASFLRRVEVPGLCLDHPGDSLPHVLGDTIRVHRESFVVELPEEADLDEVETAFYEEDRSQLVRKPLGSEKLGPEKFTPAAGRHAFCDLAFAGAVAPGSLSAPTILGNVHWPEEYGDTDVLAVYGNASEASSRINIVVVPDGYTHADKATMKAHADALVAHMRGKTPIAQHDPFFNYILVYAYSDATGTDQCDCGILLNTAMNTGFPNGNPTCGHSDNRCLYYGYSCGGDTSQANIVAAELRAPARDATLVMVNTTRYGGCGGYRAVYSAASSGTPQDIAVHELGHSLADLSDEYSYDTACGTSAGEINTSKNGTDGAWPEWISTIGAPKEGAEYYQKCLYRPVDNCEMRALNQPFCAPCNQQWARIIFGSSRVSPTAPVSSFTPASPVSASGGAPVTFTVNTRFATGTGVTNSITWQLQGPGYPTPTTVATGVTSHTRSFTQAGTYTLTCEVVADTNYVKPSKYGANRDLVTWTVDAGTAMAPEVSSTPAYALQAVRNGSNIDLKFQDVSAAHYNVYVSKTPSTASFQVSNSHKGKKECAVAGAAPAGSGMLQVTNYDPAAGLVGGSGVLYILVTADNGAGLEGSLGTNSSGAQRTADTYCNR